MGDGFLGNALYCESVYARYTLKEKEVPAERFIGLGVLFVLWGVSVLFPSFGEAPVVLMRSLFR